MSFNIHTDSGSRQHNQDTALQWKPTRYSSQWNYLKKVKKKSECYIIFCYWKFWSITLRVVGGVMMQILLSPRPDPQPSPACPPTVHPLPVSRERRHCLDHVTITCGWCTVICLSLPLEGKLHKGGLSFIPCHIPGTRTEPGTEQVLHDNLWSEFRKICKNCLLKNQRKWPWGSRRWRSGGWAGPGPGPSLALSPASPESDSLSSSPPVSSATQDRSTL